MAPRALPEPSRDLAARLVVPLFVGLLIAWGTLAFGAVYEWAYRPLAWAALATGAYGMWLGRRAAWTEKRLGLALLLLASAVCVQLIPLPASVVDGVSPAARSFLLQYDIRYALDVMQGQQGLLQRPRPLSLDAQRTLLGLGLLVAFGVSLIGLTRAFGRSGVLRLVQALVIFGVALAIFAVIQKALSPKELFDARVYGFWKPRGTGSIFGPFINRNHYAGWMLMVLPVGLGYLCALVERGLADVRPSWRDRLLWLGSPAAGKILLVGFALVVMAVSLVVSGSRSGIAGLAVALTVGAAAVARTQRTGKRRVAVLLIFGGLGLAIVSWAGLGGAFARVGSVSSEIEGRIGIWRDSLRMIGDFPLVGTGLNTFGRASLLYQTGTPLSEHYQEAHNEYLQLAVEGGLLVGIPILICIWQFLSLLRQRMREPQPRASHWLRVGAITGLVAIAVQSLVEFSLQMPANAFLLSVVAAIALHSARSTPDAALMAAQAPPRQRDRYDPYRSRSNR